MLLRLRKLNAFRSSLHSTRISCEISSKHTPLIHGCTAIRKFSIDSKKKSEENPNVEFQETLRRVKSESESKSKAAANGSTEPTSSSSSSSSSDGEQPKHEFNFLGKAKELYFSLSENVQAAYDEMRGSKNSSLRRSVQQAESFKRTKPKKETEDGEASGADADADPDAQTIPSGPSALVLVKDPVSQWERMKKRLEGSKVIRDMLKNAKKFQSAAAETDLGKQAQKIGQSFKEKMEDAREFYETSQNPLMYKVAGLISDMTAQTEEGNAQTAIMKLDPAFNKEEWADEVKRNLAPMIIKAHLCGDPKVLKPWLGEGVYNKLAADIRIRKEEGITFASEILELDENQVIMSFHDSEPIIVVSYAVQQINCIRNRQGEIIEGTTDAIVMRFYSMAFQQVYDEDEEEVKWKIIDYQYGGDTPYL